MDSYEKKYKEALANARQEYNTTKNVERKQWLENLFPELKKSDGERIRRAIIHFISHTPTVPKGIIGKETMIAWLEKQGEHHIACSEEQMKVLDEVLNFAANHESPYWNNYIFETLNNLIRQLKN